MEENKSCECGDKIKELIQSLAQSKKSESDELNELFSALSKAQADMEVAKPTKTNPFFRSKYADLANIVKSSRKHLSKNNLSVIQRIITNGNGKMYLCTRLCHSSGQWIESKMPITPIKNDVQSIGSYITYLKRYNYSSMVGVVSSEEDDDGNAAVGNEKNQQKNILTKEQTKTLSKELEGSEKLRDNILKGYRISKISDIPASQFNKCLNRIQELKEKSK